MKVLIVKTSSLGDVVHTLPAITDAKENIPGIVFDWVVEEGFAEIPSWHTSVREVIPVAWRRWRKNLFKAINSGEIRDFFKKIRKEKYDLIIDAQGLIKSSVIAFCARGLRIGYDKQSAREKYASFFYQKKYQVSKKLHAIARMRQLFSLSLGYDLPKSDPNYGVSKKLFSVSDNNDEKYIVFFHGTSREEKLWGEQNWIDLAKYAMSNGFSVYLPWGNHSELMRAKRIAQHDPVRIRVLPKLGLSSIATLLCGASGSVSLDTGLGHVAAAIGVPNVSLYGPTDTKLIGTVGSNQIHLLELEKLCAADVWQSLQQLVNPG